METRENRERERSSEDQIKDEAIRLLSPLKPLHFQSGAGNLLAIMRSGAGFKMTSIPVLNNWTACGFVKKYEQRDDFHAWAVDPFTGEANVHVAMPKMNE